MDITSQLQSAMVQGAALVVGIGFAASFVFWAAGWFAGLYRAAAS